MPWSGRLLRVFNAIKTQQIHDDAQRAFTQRLCAQLGLVPTGGSDWHGNPEMPELGDSGPVPLPEDTLERLGLA